MRLSAFVTGATLALTLAAGHAMASPSNVGPPSGNVILDLDGQAIPSGYQNYTATFTASSTSTNLSFALREDPAFLFLDDVSLIDTTAASGNLLTNGDFEAGPVGASAPSGWTYLNSFGAAFGGVVENNAFLASPGAHGGNNYYYDGAVQAYDGITQNVATVIGHNYSVNFWLADNSGLSNFSRLSTNGDVTDTGGNGIDLVVYAGAVPVGTPEPTTWALMILGFGGIGATIRRKFRTAGSAAA
jgi:hypothetical protein